MKNNIIKFAHEQFGEIRTMNIDGEAWFIGKDIAEALGYKDPSRALYDRVDDEDKTTLLIQQSGSNYKSRTTFINESGLYALILGSKLPQVKAFKRWVTAEVLPQIRKTGGYIPTKDTEGNELTEAQMLQQTLMIMKMTLDQKDNLIASQSKQISELQPSAAFAQAIEETEDSIYISELAKLLTRNGYEIGQKRLFSWLREKGYIFKDGREPMQEWVSKGIFSVNASVFEDCRGRLRENITTKVTGKGQRYFINLLINTK